MWGRRLHPAMDRFAAVDALLEDEDLDGYLHVGAGSDSDVYYLSRFDAPDPFVLLRRPGETLLLVSLLEFGRAQKEADVDEVRCTEEYRSGDDRGDPEARARILASFLDDEGVASVGVPRDFGLATAEYLRDDGVTVSVVDDVVGETREVKTAEEIAHVETAQRANERAMATAQEMLREATVDGDELVLDGEPLTAERVRTEIEVALIRNDCALDQTIVAGGPDGADPHWRGSGPLPAAAPIVVDIFPRHSSKYHSDMTRTFVRGDVPDAVREMYDAVAVAKEAALDALDEGAGVTGDAVHGAVCDAFADRGWDTTRDDDVERGFIHSTGHGVGLDVHEGPRLSEDAGELEAGNVVTVEPGLYDPDVGGVRLEDIVVVEGDGYRNLTEYEQSIEP